MRAYLKDERGAAAVEFAIILPVLVTLIAGVTSYGRAVFVEGAVRDAMDDAARTAVISGETASDVEAALTSAVAAVPGVGSYTVDVTDGTNLAITVSGTFDLFFAAYLPASTLSFSMSTQFPR
jgi:Flp pilus assembly protein TadG